MPAVVDVLQFVDLRRAAAGRGDLRGGCQISRRRLVGENLKLIHARLDEAERRMQVRVMNCEAHKLRLDRSK